MTASNWIRYRSIIIYSVSLAALLFLLKWLEWQFIIVNYAVEIYAGTIAVLFTALGIWLALKLSKPKINTIYVDREIPVPVDASFTMDIQEAARRNISNRELEVLQLMAQGLSNQQIAEQLFVSLNTIKTHAAKLFEKLEVQRRTQAVEVGKRLKLIA
ncbi:response regulator transcription factor [Mucilaginibacter sp.]|uniref:response regulator transcription factor n=1 Tax=Mucilaginibacter sp. TaxID=1882438 RepID=UPI0035BC41DC